ncbi:hypothetical protein ACFLRA_02985 [Bdellovibrionota bacterium]
MATNTSILNRKRQRKQGRKNQAKKRKIRKYGTTPAFPIHQEEKTKKS